VFELAVPSGTYRVHLVSGDANFFDGVFRVNVEGTLVVNGTRAPAPDGSRAPGWSPSPTVA
jgi:hypothetical protein